MSKIYFYVPNLNQPSGGMGVLMKQAKILNDNDFDVTFLYERKDGQDDFNPKWMDFSIDGIKKVKIKDITKLNIFKNDILVLPEGYGEYVKLTKYLKCRRVVLAQSWVYVISSMKNRFHWSDYGLYDVISVSDGITNYLNQIMSGLNIKQYKQSINHNIFKPNENKELAICFSANRGKENYENTISVINTFKEQHQDKDIKIYELKGYSREEFAEIVSKSTFCLYTDEIAGFGTLPLEAMACNTHVIGFKNIGNSEYVNDDNGFWVENSDYNALYNKLDEVFNLYLENKLDFKLNENEIITSNKYNFEDEEEQILEIYDSYYE